MPAARADNKSLSPGIAGRTDSVKSTAASSVQVKPIPRVSLVKKSGYRCLMNNAYQDTAIMHANNAICNRTSGECVGEPQ